MGFNHLPSDVQSIIFIVYCAFFFFLLFKGGNLHERLKKKYYWVKVWTDNGLFSLALIGGFIAISLYIGELLTEFYFLVM